MLQENLANQNVFLFVSVGQSELVGCNSTG